MFVLIHGLVTGTNIEVNDEEAEEEIYRKESTVINSVYEKAPLKKKVQQISGSYFVEYIYKM